jgi:glyoxylase-like metal-dependent hydrolase (beta-lactamase superfamily II)
MTAAAPVRNAAGLAFPFAPPEPGEAVAAAEGVLWLRLPLPMALDHVNVYALEDDDGWTLIDAGLNWAKGRAAWDALLAGPLAGRPVTRVILTHHHPDHVGMAARFVEQGATLWATRTAWLFARMLTLDHHDRPTPHALAFLRRAGWDAARLDAHARTEPFNFSRVVQLLPPGFRAIDDGDVLRIGARRWRVRMGGGHAPDHATLWSLDDPLVLTGDQCLPRISPNIGVYATEPEADPLSDWLKSCDRLGAEADDDMLALPGHERPFTGLRRRFAALRQGHETALARLTQRLAERPRSAVEVFPALYGRPIGDAEFGLATAEAVAHMNHLRATGAAAARVDDDSALRFRPA